MYKKTRSAGFGKEVKRRIILGTYVLSSGYYDAYYRKAGQVRALFKRDFDRAFEECDVIMTAVSPTTAFRTGEKMEDPLTMYLSDIFTIPVNLAGLPGLSVPCGFDRKGLPIGLQIIGKPLEEGLMLQAAYVCETEMQRKYLSSLRKNRVLGPGSRVSNQLPVGRNQIDETD
jgi:aspartyl-tRNA(Asn)/glutamyl-tRNA(Gln) amidotransferase subunit A